MGVEYLTECELNILKRLSKAKKSKNPLQYKRVVGVSEKDIIIANNLINNRLASFPRFPQRELGLYLTHRGEHWYRVNKARRLENSDNFLLKLYGVFYSNIFI